MCKVLQTKFFDQRHQIRSFVQSLNPISLEFENFEKFRRIKEGGKLLEQLGNSRNFSVVNQKWPKLSFLIKRQRFGDAWKVSNDVHSIW